MSETFESVLLRANLSPDVASSFRDVTILPFSLRDSQVLALQCALWWDRFGLYLGMRTGKTMVMLLLSIYMSRFGLKSVGLFPPILFDQVLEELEKIENHGISAHVLTGSAKKKERLLNDWAMCPSEAPDLLITTSDLFSGPRRAKGSKLKVGMPYYKRIAKFASVLMFDECHLGLQSEDTETFRAIEGFLKLAESSRLVLSSGTPLLTELAAAYPSIRLKTPDSYTSRTQFDNFHVNRVTIPIEVRKGFNSKTVHIPKIESYKMVDHLKTEFYKQAYRLSTLDVMPAAKLDVQVVPVHLSGPHMALYKEVVTTRVVELGEEVLDLRQQNNLFAFAQRVILDPMFAGKAIPDNAVMRTIKTLAGTANVRDGGKLAVFANYQSSVRALREGLKSYNPAVIYGGEDSSDTKNREELARFRTSKECGIIIINYQSGGVGITLGDVCNVAVMAEPTSSPGVFEQAAARILLDGQKEPALVYALCVHGTTHRKQLSRLMDKATEIQDVVRDKRTFLDTLLGK